MNGIWNEFIVAANGTKVVNTNVESVADALGLFASAGTVFTRIEKNGDTGTDVKSEVIVDPSIALLSDVLLTLPAGQYFSAITIATGGQVVEILK